MTAEIGSVLSRTVWHKSHNQYMLGRCLREENP
ncbi:MAG: hypothetical protein JWP17_3831 [Solirubrobacterales bacterium]|jgi:hypothetical protein|nr:hypothetical protein [Solirubrobacterales bacterium]